jgi:hypothetical protein
MPCGSAGKLLIHFLPSKAPLTIYLAISFPIAGITLIHPMKPALFSQQLK